MADGIDRRAFLGTAGAGLVAALLRREAEATLALADADDRAPGALNSAGTRAFSANQTITTLIPDRLYRVGCMVRAERLSWLPTDLDGFEPLNGYVVTDRDNAVFVEPGMPISLPAVRMALDTLVADRKVWVNFTRNEADCIGNMGYVLGSTKNPTLLFGSAGGILEWINDPAVSILEVRDFLGRIPIEPARNDMSKDIGALKFSWFDAGVKQMMMTQWAYEETSGCLFTSDCFGFRHTKDASSPTVVTSARNLPSVDTVAREFTARMNWLREAEYSEVLERFESIFDQYDVRMIAPVHGCVIKGREAVAGHVKLALDALHAASDLADNERMQYV